MDAGKAFGNQNGPKRNTKRRRSTAFNFFRKPSDDRNRSFPEKGNPRPVSRLNMIESNNADLAKALEKSHQREADLKDQLYQLQNDNLDLISKLQCLKEEQFIDQLASVTQHRMFIKKLIEAVELITEAVPMKWKEHNHKPMDGYTDVCRRTANQSAGNVNGRINQASFQSTVQANAENNKQGQTGRQNYDERLSDEVNTNTADSQHGKTARRTLDSTSDSTMEILRTPDLSINIERNHYNVFPDEKQATLVEKHNPDFSRDSIYAMRVCSIESETGVKSNEMDLEEVPIASPRGSFNVFEDEAPQSNQCMMHSKRDQLRKEVINVESYDVNKDYVSKRERRFLRRLQRNETKSYRRSKKANNRRKSPKRTSLSRIRREDIVLPQGDKENIDPCIQRMQEQTTCHSPVIKVVKRMFSPMLSRSPLLRQPRIKRKVSYTEPSLAKKLRRGDPMADSSLYNSPHFGSSKKKSKCQQNRQPLMQIGGSIRE